MKKDIEFSSRIYPLLLVVLLIEDYYLLSITYLLFSILIINYY